LAFANEQRAWLTQALARFWLRACDQVGVRPRIIGRPCVINSGRLLIGDDFELRSEPTQSHLIVSSGASLEIGQRVRVGSGAAISCQGRIEIGDDVSLGAFCMLMDSDFHVAGDSSREAAVKALRIERGARLGHRVIVLPGSRIGAFASVLPGSVVAGEVPEGATVEGNPARVNGAGEIDGAETNRERVIPRLVQHVLGVSRLPLLDEGPNEIGEWDSLGALRLILELETRFRITLTEDDIRSVRTVRDIIERVASAEARQHLPRSAERA
jgi:acetyltransferase-like isoleucine patch superfamily enzyme/acyl carrier protein